MLVRSCVCIEGGADGERGVDHELHPLVNSSTKTNLTISIVLELSLKEGVFSTVLRIRILDYWNTNSDLPKSDLR